nr:unnamed protein product [Callosobruchus chinensis]
MRTIVKLHEVGYVLLLHPPHSPDLAPSDFFCGQNNAGYIRRKWTYFEAKDKSCYRNSIEQLLSEATVLDNKSYNFIKIIKVFHS